MPNALRTNANRAAALIVVIQVFLSIVLAQDGGSVKQLIDAIRKGPSLYRTQEAMRILGRQTSPTVANAVTGPEALAAIKQSIRACITLGELGDKARDAVPELIETFPQAEHAVVISGAQYGPGMGGFEDWIQTFVVSEKNKFIMSSSFVEYNTLTKCEKWVEASATTDTHQRRTVGGKTVEAVADIYITLRINAAACALSQITGGDGGASRESWRQWYERSRSTYGATSTPSAAAEPPIKVITVSAFPVVDYTIGARYEIELTTRDKVRGAVEATDENSVTIVQDDGSRYNYQKSFIRNRIALSPPQPAAQPSAQPAVQSKGASSWIPYDKLLDLSYSGKMMEVVISNGTTYRGTLGVVDASILHLNVDGVEMPISRNVIVRISEIEPIVQPKTPDAPAAGPTPW